MLARCFQDEVQLFTQGARAEEEDHDEGVGKAHFGAVDGAIAGRFDDGKKRLEGRVEDNGFETVVEEGDGC